MGITSLTINKLGESLGTKRVKRSKNDGKSTIRMQEINIEWIFTSLLLSRYRGKVLKWVNVMIRARYA
ncbi:hypothetical protein HanXRQr2_Chr16g0739741 [Helianthus annuus]|uniref:Uncharacterized protein n=1 Tax=Helianthus annuus TaxID=4232 RepID=A0A251RXJ0_HELAN|nr:hypothetical protein HanXRQr2_Chr16g0739741 [Helianthus annuus]KAJ0945487.1 hypothetical protein HanPSC8_Chr03g0128711 [Helianthus annuus]